MSGVATFSPPLPAVGSKDQLPRILIGLVLVEEDLVAVAVDGDGRMELLMLTEFLVDWRYDPKSQLWDGPRPQAAGDFGDEEGYGG